MTPTTDWRPRWIWLWLPLTFFLGKVFTLSNLLETCNIKKIRSFITLTQHIYSAEFFHLVDVIYTEDLLNLNCFIWSPPLATKDKNLLKSIHLRTSFNIKDWFLSVSWLINIVLTSFFMVIILVIFPINFFHCHCKCCFLSMH